MNVSPKDIAWGKSQVGDILGGHPFCRTSGPQILGGTRFGGDIHLGGTCPPQTDDVPPKWGGKMNTALEGTKSYNYWNPSHAHSWIVLNLVFPHLTISVGDNALR